MTAADIRARLEAATPGPWGTLADTYRSVPMHRIGADISGADVAQVIAHGAQEAKDAALIANAPTDIARLLAALDAVLEWCATNQHPYHPSEGAEGFSSQDWALDDAARRIRTAISTALEGK